MMAAHTYFFYSLCAKSYVKSCECIFSFDLKIEVHEDKGIHLKMFS